jgi:GNAT superfamily N-acetyltransferase
MTRDEFDFMADDFRKIVDPELVLIAEFRGEPVGFLLGLPNYNEVLIRIGSGRLFPLGLFKVLWYKHRIQGVRVITLGIKRDYQGFGLGSLFYAEIARRIVDRGYAHAEMSWVMEDNTGMNKAARLLGGRVYKTYRVYQKSL